MMMIPRKHDFDLFDDVFGDSFFNEGASRLMKTDIKEKKNEYIIDIDLPGYDKEGIKLEIQDGYLTVHASVNKEENDEEKGRFVRKERYSGACSRSFYVGENITEDEIKAKLLFQRRKTRKNYQARNILKLNNEKSYRNVGLF